MKSLKYILYLLAPTLQFTYSFAQNDSGKILNSFDKTKIYYEVRGQGEAVILVHGFSGTGDSWKSAAVYNDLVSAGYKVITLDQRGNGRSEKPHQLEAYENDAEAKDIMAVADELKLQRYAIVGYSRGAIITSRVFVRDRRVTRAVLGGMGADFMNPDWPRRIMFYRALSGDSVPELRSFLQYVKDKNLDQTALAYQQKAQPSTSAAEFAAVRKPVLVICGDNDNDNGSAKELAAFIPTATFISVPGNHNNASKSKEFSNAVLQFIAPKGRENELKN